MRRFEKERAEEEDEMVKDRDFKHEVRKKV